MPATMLPPGATFVREWSEEVSEAWSSPPPSPSRRVIADSTLFPDSNTMKERLREQMVRPQYNVTNFYKKEGFTQWLARHPRFEHAVYVLILLNAVWLAIDTDRNQATMLMDAKPLFQIVEHFFCVCFTYELLVRFLAFERKTNACRDPWFVFDLVLVSFMVFETWVIPVVALAFGDGGEVGGFSILRLVRLLRLSRVARVARLFRAVPELCIIIRGLGAAVRSVGFTMVLLLSIIYVYAIAFTQLCAGTGCEASFPNVLLAVHTLLLSGALMGDPGSIAAPLEQQSPALLLLFYSFLLLAAVPLMNMLIGVICEVVSAVAATEREAMTLVFVKERIKELMSLGDDNADCQISKQEFLQLLSNKAATTILEDVGVDVVGLVDFADTIFEPDCRDEIDGPQERVLSFADFMGVVLDLRGTNTATLRDITQLRRHINDRFTRLEQKLLDVLPTSQCSSSSRVQLQLKKASTEPLTLADLVANPVAYDEMRGGWRSSWGNAQQKDSDQHRPSNQLQALHGIVDTVIQQCMAEHERELEALRAKIQTGPTDCTDMQSPFNKPSLLSVCPAMPESSARPTSVRPGGHYGLGDHASSASSAGPPPHFGASPSTRPHTAQQPVPSKPTEAFQSASLPGTPVPKGWAQQPATPARGKAPRHV